MKVQFLNVKDMIKELDQFIEKPLIRIQDLRYCLNTKEHGIPIHEFEIEVTTLVKDELWYYIERCGSKIIFDKDDDKDLVERTRKTKNGISKLFEAKNFEIKKGIYMDGEIK